MPLIRPGIRRLFALALRRPEMREREVNEEIALHLELRAEQLRREGLSAEDARREARRRFGELEAARHALTHDAHRRDRTMGWREWIDGAAQDTRYALRGLRREPLFTGFAVTSLALGIGANAAVYGVVDRLLLSGPEHLREPDRVVRIVATVNRPTVGETTSGSFGYVMYDHLREHARAFDGVAAWDVGQSTLGRGRSARTIQTAYTTAGFFPLLGVRPALGRFYQPDEDDPASPAHVVVLGDALWRGQFDADSSVIGREIELGDSRYTVVGVAPGGFTGVQLRRVDAWIPLSIQSQDVTDDWTRAWNAQWLYLVARLKDGMSVAAAGSEATRAHRASYDGPPTRLIGQARLEVLPLHFTKDGVEPGEISVARWLLGVTAIVLLIACTNVSNLLLARAVRRRGEVGVRLALGAARARLARLFFTESLLLAAMGCVAGLGVAGVLSIAVRKFLITNIEWIASPVSGRLLLVAVAVSLAVGLLAGLAPAAHAARGSLMSVIQRGHGASRLLGLGAWPSVLQACLTACLLVGAGVFMLSFHRARTVDLGFESDRVLVAQITWTVPEYGDTTRGAMTRPQRQAVWRRAMERVSGMPDVEATALAVGTPFGSSFSIPLFLAGHDSIPRLPTGGPYISAVTSDYFATAGTRLLRGRLFLPNEREGTDLVAIVNETMAKTLWPGRDAIGECVRMWEANGPCSQVVGVVEDARRYELREDPTMQYYVPFGQERGFGGTSLFIRPRKTPRAAFAVVQAAIESDQAVVERADVWPIRDSIDPILRPWRLGATVFAMGGVLALLVAAVGLFSVMSYAVAQRGHELGVRIALGASSRNIIGLIMRQALFMTAAGVAGGILVSLYAERWAADLLFETSVREPIVFGAMTVVLLLTAASASLLPALRARRVDPMRALRTD